jgi:DNA polymerase type B, organellar and viral
MFYAPLPILRDYNERDCQILHGAISRFQTELNEMGTDLRITVASTAMRLFRRKYLKHPIETSTVISDRIRAGYIASRVEPYKAEATDEILEWDINSSFPFAMTKPTPGSMIGNTRRIPKKGVYFAECTVQVPTMFLPPLGRRGRDGRIYFPTGEWSGLFSRPDLELLEEAGGTILSVKDVLLFESRSDFSDYATDLYDKRKKEKDPFVKILLKYLLNSCYGKTAESREKTRLVLHPYSEDCPHNGIHQQGSIATCVEILFPGAILITEEKDIPHEHVPIAAQITSEARRTLYRYAARCGEDLYYSDTDSLYTHKCFESTNELGGLKLERKVPPPSIFVSPKLYLAGGKVKSKGFSHLSEEKFRSLIGGDPVSVERMLRIREIARTKQLIGPQLARIEKKLAIGAHRPKRRVLPGNCSEAWTVSEIDSKWDSALHAH